MVSDGYSHLRRHRRFTVDLLDIQGSTEISYAVTIRDISISGLSIRCEKILQIGRFYTIRLMDEKRDILCKATVVWCEESPASDRPNPAQPFLAGLSFIDLGPDALSSIIAFIESHIIGKHALATVHDMSGYRCNLRFHVESQESALLAVPETYKVRLISMGGLLIESARPFEPESRLAMELKLGEGRKLSFSGRVTSCTPLTGESKGSYGVGFAFLGMTEADLHILRAFIRELYLADEANP